MKTKNHYCHGDIGPLEQLTEGHARISKKESRYLSTS